MTSFSFAVQSTCLVVLGSLVVYTVALMRSGRLSAFITVRWIIAETIAIAAVLVWGRLPVIAFTSSLGDRELLVILAVMFFGLITFLMLDSLQRISDHSGQLRRLTQEVALLHERLAATVGTEFEATTPQNFASPLPRKRPGPEPFAITIMVMWIVGCVAVYLVQSAGSLPASVVRLLSAAYLK
jgi:hypothetical protein